MKECDRDNTGKISYHDFMEISECVCTCSPCSYLLPPPSVSERVVQRDPHEEMLKAFRLFDDDDTGKITLRNLRRVARELGENVSDDELRAMIDEFDTDHDGESECVGGTWEGLCFTR